MFFWPFGGSDSITTQEVQIDQTNCPKGRIGNPLLYMYHPIKTSHFVWSTGLPGTKAYLLGWLPVPGGGGGVGRYFFCLHPFEVLVVQRIWVVYVCVFCCVSGFAIITWNNTKKLEKPWITKGQYLAIFRVDFIMYVFSAVYQCFILPSTMWVLNQK